MNRIRRLLMYYIFQEERRALWIAQSLSIQRLVKKVFGRRIKGFRVYPATLKLGNDWIIIKATAEKVHDDKNVELEVETRFDLEKSHIVVNLHWPETGEIRQKQLSLEYILA